MRCLRLCEWTGECRLILRVGCLGVDIGRGTICADRPVWRGEPPIEMSVCVAVGNEADNTHRKMLVFQPSGWVTRAAGVERARA